MSREFDIAINKIVNNITSGIQVGLHYTGKDILAERIKNSKENKTGRDYIIYINGRRKKHKASAPFTQGEGSAKLTGKKNKATKFNIKGMALHIGVQRHIKYAHSLEKTRGDIQKASRKIAKEKLRHNIIHGVKLRFNS